MALEIPLYQQATTFLEIRREVRHDGTGWRWQKDGRRAHYGEMIERWKALGGVPARLPMPYGDAPPIRMVPTDFDKMPVQVVKKPRAALKKGQVMINRVALANAMRSKGISRTGLSKLACTSTDTPGRILMTGIVGEVVLARICKALKVDKADIIATPE